MSLRFMLRFRTIACNGTFAKYMPIEYGVFAVISASKWIFHHVIHWINLFAMNPVAADYTNTNAMNIDKVCHLASFLPSIMFRHAVALWFCPRSTLNVRTIQQPLTVNDSISFFLEEYDCFKAALQDEISPADTLKDRFNAPSESQRDRETNAVIANISVFN